MPYNHKEIEKKWQKYWEENKTFHTPNPGDKDFDETKPKYYVLDMFPYPSGAGLHVGHPEGYTANDIIARYKKAKGYNVLHPMGWDAFGLPAENYAIKTGTHPEITTNKNIDNFRKQIKSLGFSYDWDREISTTDPNYYKWTQWIFLKMFEHGLAYEQDLPINYCPSCKTGLANEEVLKDGTCERCGTKVIKKPIRQWVLAITKYADRLAKDVDKLDWPEGIKEMQKNWIGRSEGTQFKMDVVNLRSEEESEEIRREDSSEEIRGRENLNKKNEVRILDLIQVGLNCPASTSSEEKINQKIIKINRKKHFANHIQGYVINNGKKILFDSKNILKHFKSKSLKEFRYRKNLLGTVYKLLDKIDFDSNGIGYFIVGKIVVKVVLGKQSNGNYFIKTFYKSDRHTEAYKKLIKQNYEKIGEIQVYTTRIDTVFGMSYAVIAPDHKDVKKFIQPEYKQACEEYIQNAINKSDLERTADNKEKTGIFTGSYVVNPYNGDVLPLWISDYVLGHYGTGAVMAVPAHDERDFAFAKKYNLPIKQVIAPKDGKEVELPFTEYGILINSGEFSGLTSQEAKKVLTEYAEKNGFGFKKVNYKLRDWIFSRQRYWGEPIPLIHITNEDYEKLPKISDISQATDPNKAYVLLRQPKDGEKVDSRCMENGMVRELIINGKPFSKIYDGLYGKIVIDWNLPLKLPEVEKYEPAGDGQGPLARIDNWVNVKLAENLNGKRETNTMPQWAGSCWYYLRFMDPKNDKFLVAPEIEKYWGQVDSYVGGAEHAVLHLLYARFWHKFLYDIGVVSYDEPFKRLRNQGLILAYAYQRKNGGLVPTDMVEERDGKYYHKETGEELEKVIAKMSKSLKNVVNPDDIIEEYGADALRLYEMYMADFKDSAPWDVKGIVGVRRFLDKVYRAFVENDYKTAKNDDEAIRLLHKTIKKVSQDIENYKFNTAIAQLMILLNYGLPKDETKQKQWKETFVKLLHPFAPHLAEEIYQNYLNLENKKQSIFFESWPEYDENLAKDEEITIAIQVMGKLRGNIKVPVDLPKEKVLELAKKEPNVSKWLEGKTIVKEIYVPGKIVNFVVK